MTWLQWLGENWVDVLQSFAILSGFWFTCVTLRRDENSRRAANNFRLIAHHSELWSIVFTIPELHRVQSSSIDLAKEPVTDGEVLFVRLLILHLSSAYQAITKKVLDRPEGLGADIRTYFALPIPRFVWENEKGIQDVAFVRFVESHMASNQSK